MDYYGTTTTGTSAFIVIFYLLIGIIVGGAILVIAYLLYQQYRYNRKKIPRSIDTVLLKILLPKQPATKIEDETKRDPKNIIASASQLFASLYSIKDAKLSQWWKQKGAHMSFEIAAFDGMISFFIGVPKETVSLIEKQIHSLYPNASLEEVGRYDIFDDETEYVASELMLKNAISMPIRTYKEFESDTLNTLTNALSKLEKEENAAIQILIRPANTKWNKLSEYHVKQLQEGKGLKGGGKMINWNSIFEFSGEVLSAPFEPLKEKSSEGGSQKPKTISPLTEQKIKIMGEKAGYVGFEAVIRIVVTSPQLATAKMHLANITSAFTVFNHPAGNQFTINKKRKAEAVANDFIFRSFPFDASKTILNTEELASIFHFPNRNIETPNIAWMLSKRAPVAPEVPKEGLYLGVNIFRGVRTPVYMKPKDRVRHTYIIGKTGTGKSTLMKEMIIQDIKNGEGVCYIDPHGTDTDDLLSRIPKERVGDVILFNPADFERPMGLNLLEYTRPEEKTLVVGELMNVFDKLYDLKSTGGPMFEQYFRNAALLVMEHPESGSTLMEIPKVLADEEFRAFKLSKCANPVIRDYWRKEAEKAGGEAALANVVPYVTSKLTQFIANDIMRPIVAQQKSAFNIRDIMDNQKILLMRLTKGQIGELNAYLLGLIMVSKIYLAAMSRVDMPEEKRKPFYVYIDEFQNFTTDSVSSILSEARKYQLALTIGHQFIGQLTVKGDSRIRDAVFGNVGTFITFRVGEEDAEFLEKKYTPVFNANDISNVDTGNAYVSLLVDNTNLKPFSLYTFLDFSQIHKDQKIADSVVQLSRLRYGRDRDIIESEIRNRAI